MTAVVKKERALNSLKVKLGSFDYDALENVLDSLDIETVERCSETLNRIFIHFHFAQKTMEDSLSIFFNQYDGCVESSDDELIELDNFNTFLKINSVRSLIRNLICSPLLQEMDWAKQIYYMVHNCANRFLMIYDAIFETFQKHFEPETINQLIQYAREAYNLIVAEREEFESKIKNKVFGLSPKFEDLKKRDEKIRSALFYLEGLDYRVKRRFIKVWLNEYFGDDLELNSWDWKWFQQSEGIEIPQDLLSFLDEKVKHYHEKMREYKLLRNREIGEVND